MPSSKQIKNKRVLVTGGLGFIGFNVASYFAPGNRVLVVDDASRTGVENNIKRLAERKIDFVQADISSFPVLKKIFEQFHPNIVIHMAAQVAVTTSIVDPVRDFYANALGSFNLLELARQCAPQPILLYASTNKVYGCDNANVELRDGRYQMADAFGYSEKTPLSFETPYGCSKGAADQYCLDYHRIFGVPTVVFRQSCIYGPNQYGLEDQGWVAWFGICAAFHKPITIFGDGNQVRDVLYIDDLLALYEKSIVHIDRLQGQAFNIGGGPAYTLSPNELVRMLERKTGKSVAVNYAQWRPRDQKVYISDIRKIAACLDWQPQVDPETGIQRLLGWINDEQESVSLVHEQLRLGK
ncbi:MAG: hypothetical protein A3D10_09020 [Omnitrophica WOR_2 bacterium RIFCSPHIGHO2_02_FULL_48_11]|nr:MAG: hypothetical protein A3D10_09020 [Omnitrophica WOR_2 bacterium RIFCSPHIGHO2_02_FULL_48_11]